MTRVLILWACLLTAACGMSQPPAPHKADAYLYEDTRRLVESVESAADLVEKRGAAAAFAEFGSPRSRWQRSSARLFVYDVGGTCVWHGAHRPLVGRHPLDIWL